MSERTAPADPIGLPRLSQSYAEALPALSTPHQADPAPDPQLVALGDSLARDLGIDPDVLRSPTGLALLTGRLDAEGRPVPEDGTPLSPDPPFTTAQAYAGYQFGQPSPVLGDGRALLLGDLLTPAGDRVDLHLKGSGPTPFARAGDGKAPLGPMLREHLVGEAMHALGIPTTRSLAVVTTGEHVRRRGPVPEPAAILTRVAASHLRVGTFQFAAWHLGPETVAHLAEYAIERHWPAAREESDPVLGLLRAVTHAQAELIAQWMLVGFVHGVMNTDNMTISGQTIDYGPCAFLDQYSSSASFSSIDTGGRYAYGNQPGIALWNLSRFAEALLPAIDGETDAAVTAATAVLEEFEGVYLRAWTRGMAAKLGIALPEPDMATDDAALAQVRALGEDALAMLEASSTDFTLFFRSLTEAPERARDLVGDADAFDAWHARLQEARATAPAGEAEAALARMRETNPIYIPRNLPLERALQSAALGDLSAFERLLDAVRDPFTRRAGLEDLEGPGADADAGFVTFCGT